MNAKADVLLVTATKVESHAVMQAFEKAPGGHKATPHPIDDRTYFDLGAVKGARVFLTQSEMGAGGLDASLLTVQKGIDALSPTAVIMVGVAFGVDEKKQAIGDILVTENLRLYPLQHVGTHDGRSKIDLRGDRPHASPWLIGLLKSADLQWTGAEVRFGVVLTGEKLVDNVAFRDQLKQFEPETIGGEMEGAGLYVACQDKKVDWILVKAICDWADGNITHEKKARQQTAAKNAAEFVLHALQFAQVDWEKRRGETAHAQTDTSSDRAAANVGAVTGGAAAPAPVRSSLPHQPYFFGREKELKSIAEAISPEARTWGALIDGPGGIGKTALAVRAGILAPAEHFPLKIFLSAKVRDLHPSGEQPLQDFMLPNYQELLKELGREIGEDTLERIDPNERAKAVRNALADKRALIVIDNVETFPEAERNRLYQFLVRLPAACKAIVTSRRRTDIDARAIRLDRLLQDEALAFIAELAKANRRLEKASETERRALYETTNGNPLLIRWVAGQLGRGGSQCRTIAEACDFLKAAPKGNDPLEYIFGDLIDTFTESETAVLAALTHFRTPAKVDWVAELSALSHSVALTALEDLSDRAILVADEPAESFFLPLLAAEFLRRKRPEAVAQTGDRLANRAFALAIENGHENYERFPVLEAEWPTIAAALPRLIQGDNDRLQSVCNALTTFLDFSGRWDERLDLSQQVEEKALAAKDFYNAGWRVYDIGFICYLRGQADEVMACAKRCAAYWEKDPEAGAWEKATAIRLRGLGHEVAKDYPAAIEAYQEALNLWCAIAPESKDVAIGLNDLAMVEYAQGNYDAAERDYREAVRIAKKVRDRDGVAIYTGNLADMALDRKDWAGAETLARKALGQAEKLGRQEEIARECGRLALALARQGKPAEGLSYAHRAVEIFTKLRQPDELKKAQAALKECGG